MEKRIQIDVLEPEAYKAMYALEKYLGTTKLTNTHKELIKIRASQINSCAFCIDMHTKDALKYGETQQRIFLISAWRETDLFSEEEKVILQITEEVTLIHQKGLSSEVYKKALQFFDENYLAQIIMAITTINAWNRIAVSTHKPF
ncbi:carboxymuconolactone decarboxylase family protein [Joostella atrarenae]|uniref:Carboxymuconolactone decarboxylase family protein n=1 Tax=Joostella atrarenae TaxID=679257 RepID=A0ABS9IYS6_9FLAO|nr:carboxymuconolactone decarboxylase family protein [Joostella atrarenae]MCF8713329.1 carboxymuconolactone decarboxylase family protein [Joostella atrarenae]